jgi:hypothetical protein
MVSPFTATSHDAEQSFVRAFQTRFRFAWPEIIRIDDQTSHAPV